MAKPTKVRLYATQGSDEANHSMSTKPYRVDNNGIVEVDEEAVGPLLEKGGFIRVEEPEVEVPTGSVRVVHVSDPDATCSHAGVSFAPESDGSIVVPVTAAPHLAAHGFVPAPEPVEAPSAPEATDKPAAASLKAEKKQAGADKPAS